MVTNTLTTCTNTSNAVTVNINTHPSITISPLNPIQCPGSELTFTAYAEGTTPFAYQWFKNGSQINNATNSSYNLNFLTEVDAGTYKCIVTNVCGNATSNESLLTLNNIPSVTLNPSNPSLCQGADLTFISTANGTNPIYKWYKNNMLIANATSSSYKLSSINSSDEADYYCTTGSDCGNATSNTSTLTILYPPASADISPPNSIECLGENIAFFVSVTGGSMPLSYQWLKMEAGNWKPETGRTTNNYQMTGIKESDAANYSCTITNACGNITSSITTLTVYAEPVITYITPDKTACSGDTASLKVIATGNPLNFQWLKEGSPINGATDSRLLFNPINQADAGNYSCNISNICNSKIAHTIMSVREKVIFTDTISNLTKCQGENVTITFNATGTNLSYQWTKGAGDIIGATFSTYTINNVKLTDYDIYSCKVSNDCGTKSLPKFILTVVSPPTSNIKFVKQIKYPGDNASYSLSPGGTSPFAFQWIKSGVEIEGETNSIFNINSIECGDSGVYSCNITNSCKSVTAKIVRLYVLNCSRFKHAVIGQVKYDNKDSTPMTNTIVHLLNMTETPIDSSTTDINGNYVFIDLVNETYKLKGSTSKNWGGSNPADALLVNRNYIGLYNITDPLKKLAADVNNDGKRNPTDALIINRRYIGLLNKFTDKNKVTLPDWLFSNPNLTLASQDTIQNIIAICRGDVNASYNPPLRIMNYELGIRNEEVLNVEPDKPFDIPVYLNESVKLGALGIKLKVKS